MNKIRCMLIDDEPPAIQLLEKYCSLIDGLEVVGTCHSAVQAFDLLREVEVDLLFLDIQMPVLNGLDFIKTLQQPPGIILTTAYREYALDGYDLDIIDYLLKPIAFDRFLKAVDRYRGRVQLATPSGQEAEHTEDFLLVNVNRTMHKIVLSDIRYVQSLKDYYRLHLTDGTMVVKGNIGSVEAVLPAPMFVRIHRSYIINREAVTAYSKQRVHIDDVDLPIGVSYKGVLDS